MSEIETRPTLLRRLKNPRNDDSWREFLDIYTPLVYSFFLKRGVPPSDVPDIIQEVMRSTARAMASFDYTPRKGSFRSWFFKIAHNKLTDWYRRRKAQPQANSETEIWNRLEQEPICTLQAQWDLDYKRQMFQWAQSQVKTEFNSQTWQAFWLTCVENVPAPGVADQLGMSVGAVYIAKSRVLSRLRNKIEMIAAHEAVHNHE